MVLSSHQPHLLLSRKVCAFIGLGGNWNPAEKDQKENEKEEKVITGDLCRWDIDKQSKAKTKQTSTRETHEGKWVIGCHSKQNIIGYLISYLSYLKTGTYLHWLYHFCFYYTQWNVRYFSIKWSGKREGTSVDSRKEWSMRQEGN